MFNFTAFHSNIDFVSRFDRRLYYCDCQQYCHGERKQVSHRTYHRHAHARIGGIAQAFDAFFGAGEPEEEPEIEDAGDEVDQAMDENGADEEPAMDVAGDGRPQGDDDDDGAFDQIYADPQYIFDHVQDEIPGPNVPDNEEVNDDEDLEAVPEAVVLDPLDEDELDQFGEYFVRS